MIREETRLRLTERTDPFERLVTDLSNENEPEARPLSIPPDARWTWFRYSLFGAMGKDTFIGYGYIHDGCVWDREGNYIYGKPEPELWPGHDLL